MSIFPKVTRLIKGTARTQTEDYRIPEPLLLFPMPGRVPPSRVVSHRPLYAPSSVSCLSSSSFSSSSSSNPSSFSLTFLSPLSPLPHPFPTVGYLPCNSPCLPKRLPAGSSVGASLTEVSGESTAASAHPTRTHTPSPLSPDPSREPEFFERARSTTPQFRAPGLRDSPPHTPHACACISGHGTGKNLQPPLLPSAPLWPHLPYQERKRDLFKDGTE